MVYSSFLLVLEYNRCLPTIWLRFLGLFAINIHSSYFFLSLKNPENVFLKFMYIKPNINYVFRVIYAPNR